MRKVIFLHSPRFWQQSFGPNHPLRGERLQRTYELLDEYRAFEPENVQVITPTPPSEGELALFHTQEYIDAVRSLSKGETHIPSARYGFGPGDNPVFTGMFESSGLKVGSALRGAKLLANLECEIAFSYSGGTHHAGPALASGFCIFNDAAVAIHWLIDQGLRIAYVDIDVHHGDGVQDAFYATDKVLTISLHQSGRTLFPGTGFVDEIGVDEGEGYSVNIPLPPYTDDEIYLWAFQQTVPPLVERFKPDILVTQLGVDTHYFDPLARLALTTHGHKALFEELSRLSSRWLALGGGGYDIDVVPRSWTLAFGIMSGQSFPEELPPDYQAKYGGKWLEDHQSPRIDENVKRLTRRSVEEIVNHARELHGLV
ncbi:MAG: acetoin utilization protein AcuC [Anaerolineaceae bacterium]|nr:MAG: acetoin utilization protein AcuC [Anaerolineaceae bacterium]